MVCIQYITRNMWLRKLRGYVVPVRWNACGERHSEKDVATVFLKIPWQICYAETGMDSQILTVELAILADRAQMSSVMLLCLQVEWYTVSRVHVRKQKPTSWAENSSAPQQATQNICIYLWQPFENSRIPRCGPVSLCSSASAWSSCWQSRWHRRP